jgi:hypothetical protein
MLLRIHFLASHTSITIFALKILRHCPIPENSPAIYGWVHGSETSQVPSGTKEMFARQ